MRVIVNGAEREVAEGATVAQVVAEVTAAASGVAVAVGDEVVRRGEWDVCVLRAGERVEVLTAVQGG